MIGIRDPALLVPAVVADVNPERVAVRAQPIDAIAVAIDHEIGAPVAALDVRIEAEEPGGMRGRTGAVGEPVAQPVHEIRGREEAGPGG